jgi:hypothetical protein
LIHSLVASDASIGRGLTVQEPHESRVELRARSASQRSPALNDPIGE